MPDEDFKRGYFINRKETGKQGENFYPFPSVLSTISPLFIH